MPTMTGLHAACTGLALERSLGRGWQSRPEGCRLYGQTMSGAAVVTEFLKFCHAGTIFGIPGGASLPLNDALTAGHHEGAFRYVLTGHEQGAGFEAEGFAAASGRPGFCTATSGPGATNLITPLADALRDSRPVIALTGNTATTAEAEAFQGLDIAGITGGKVTKASYRPTHPDQVQEALVQALHAAVNGRPGSVLVDLPRDVQVKTTRLRPWEDLLDRLDWSVPRAGDDQIAALARRLAEAARPLICAGNGVVIGGATDIVRTLSHRYGIPVATTVHGLGVLPAGELLNLGMLGMHGTMAANLAPYLADVVVVLGGRFDDRVVGAAPDQFAPTAFVAHVDIDAGQLNRVRRVDAAIHGDVLDTTERLLAELGRMPRIDRRAWHAELQTIRRALPTPSHDREATDSLSHEWVYTAMTAALRSRDARECIATFDVGTHQMKAAQWFPVASPRSFLTSGGMGTMGAALPMAVGAHFARPEALILAVCGDGGFVMSGHELDTIGGYGLPIKMIVFDDASLGMVSNQHNLYCEGRKLTSDRRRGRPVRAMDVADAKERLRQELADAISADDLAATITAAAADLARHEWPLFAVQAAASGIPAERVHDKERFARAFERALAAPGPYLIQVMLPAAHTVYPLIEPGTTPQDIVWRETFPGSGEKVHARDHFDYASRRFRAETDSDDVA